MRRKNKAQGSLFDLHVVTGIPEDTRPEVRVPVVIKFPAKPEGVVRVKVGLSVMDCPECGGHIRQCPDGTRRCGKCWWWQGMVEQ